MPISNFYFLSFWINFTLEWTFLIYFFFYGFDFSSFFFSLTNIKMSFLINVTFYGVVRYICSLATTNISNAEEKRKKPNASTTHTELLVFIWFLLEHYVWGLFLYIIMFLIFCVGLIWTILYVSLTRSIEHLLHFHSFKCMDGITDDNGKEILRLDSNVSKLPRFLHSAVRYLLCHALWWVFVGIRRWFITFFSLSLTSNQFKWRKKSENSLTITLDWI